MDNRQEENNRMDYRMMVKKCYAFNTNKLTYLVQIKQGYDMVFNEEVITLQSVNEVADLFKLNDFDWIK